jgi:hypothetical protein
VSRAPDIEDLEKKLNSGGSYEELSRGAIEIYERFRDEAKKLKRSRNIHERDRLSAEVDDFDEVINQIEERRGEHALDQFKEYFSKNPPD